MIKFRSLIGLLLLLSLMVMSWFYFSYQQFIQAPINIEQPVIMDADKGVGAYALSNQLLNKSILQQPYYIKLHLWLNQDQYIIKAGRYKILPGMNIRDVFLLFTEGKQVEYSIALIEGHTFEQAREIISANPYLKHDTQQMTDAELLKAMGADETFPEGLLFADTYSFPYQYSELALYKRAYGRLKSVLNKAWQERVEDLPYESPYDALIMASIIEKETALESERAKIAGVFVRRLKKNMRLQTDPTVIYGIGKAYTGNIKRIHLKTDTPYNTYTRHGLPPTPISLVGREAIVAALNPEPGNALYFVAKGDGSHYFSDTLQQHNKAVRKYQLRQ